MLAVALTRNTRRPENRMPFPPEVASGNLLAILFVLLSLSLVAHEPAAHAAYGQLRFTHEQLTSGAG